MFSLNLNGIFLLTMFKKSYFLKWDSPPQTAYTAVPLTTQVIFRFLHHMKLVFIAAFLLRMQH